jgi:hypothetical protein
MVTPVPMNRWVVDETPRSRVRSQSRVIAGANEEPDVSER